MYQVNAQTKLDECGILEEYAGWEEQTQRKNRCQLKTQMMPFYPLSWTMKRYKDSALTRKEHTKYRIEYLMKISSVLPIRELGVQS